MGKKKPGKLGNFARLEKGMPVRSELATQYVVTCAFGNGGCFTDQLSWNT